jgi:hypothetical protein
VALLAVSENVQIAAMFFSFLTTVFTGVMGYYLLKLKGGQDKAAVEQGKTAGEVATVKTTLADTTAAQDRKLDDIAAVGHDTARTAEAVHTLVNSNMGTALHVNKVVTRRLADLTQDRTDEIAANLAEKMYAEHQTKQATVDAHNERNGGS